MAELEFCFRITPTDPGEKPNEELVAELSELLVDVLEWRLE